MSRYNRAERVLAKMLAHFPRAKQTIKRTYQHAVYLRHRQGVSYRCEHRLSSFGRPGTETFFGYYDKSPISPDGRHLLWHESVIRTSRPPDPATPLSVVVADATGVELHRWQTRAYNWQQGARLQWLDDGHIAFNDYDPAGGRYVTRVVSPAGETVRVLPMALAEAHGAAGIGIGLDFRRLAALRPDYGYFNLPPRSLAEIDPSPNDDGLWVVNLHDGSAELAVSLRALALQTDREAIHKVNHPMISPAGTRCIFMHRYRRKGQRLDRLMVLDLMSGQVRELTNTGMVSHMAWRSDRELFGYLRGPDGRDGFFTIQVDTGQMRPIGRGTMDVHGDGHPSIAAGVVVYDTYPDKARMQHLFRVDLDGGDEPRVQLLGSFFHGLQYDAECRCDLHPRFGRSCRQVFFDSVCEGGRRLWSLELVEG
jgi:hypothetical protein